MNEATSTALITRETASIIPIVPANYQEIISMAQLLAKTQMVPKDFQNKWENVAVTIQFGLEVGLYPMQALQNIACINGRPCIWGDAMLALVRASGLLEYIKEQKDSEWATCEAKRKNDPEKVCHTFTKADAERAGLWGKQGPWKQYPQRMLQMRARSFVLRDLFPDVLKGISMAEEAQDIIDIVATPVKTEKKIDLSTPPADLAPPNLEALKTDPKPVPEKKEEPVPASSNSDAVPTDAQLAAEESADDIPIDAAPVKEETLSDAQIKEFENLTRELKLTVKELVAYLKKNGWADISKIPAKMFELAKEGLRAQKEK